MRSEKVIKNTYWKTINTTVSILIGFFNRTLFIYLLSEEYLGIDGLFTNILSILSLSELGFSTAVTFNLYKPLKENDNRKIAAIMNFYCWVYRIVALFILIAGLLIIPFLGYLIKESSFELSYLRRVYVIFLLQTVSSYFYSYNYTLAAADQKSYLTAKITLISQFFIPTVKLVVLAITRNFICYLVVGVVFSIIFQIIQAFYIKSKYPVLLDRKSKLDRKEKNQLIENVKDLFLGKISTVILNSTDNIIISAFVNITTVGLLSNYNTLIGYIMQFVSGSLYTAQASIGNAVASETKEYNKRLLNRFTMITFFCAIFCSTALFCLSSDFVRLVWSKKRDLSLPMLTVFILMFNTFFQIIKQPLWITLNVCGLFKKDKYISAIGAVANLVISIALVNVIGLNGVILGTIISQSIQLVLKSNLLFRDYFEESCIQYLLKIASCFLLAILVMCGTEFVCSIVPISNKIICFICKMGICVVLPNFVTYCLYGKTDEFLYLKNMIINTIVKKMRIRGN